MKLLLCSLVLAASCVSALSQPSPYLTLRAGSGATITTNVLGADYTIAASGGGGSQTNILLTNVTDASGLHNLRTNNAASLTNAAPSTLFPAANRTGTGAAVLSNGPAITAPTFTSTTTLNGVVKLNAASNSITVVNLGLDANGFATTNASAIGGGTTPSFNTSQFNSSGGTTNIANAAPVTNLVSVGVVALTDAATIATDASLGNTFRVTLGGNRTLGNPTNAKDGQRLTFELIQDGTGSRTITMDTKFAFGTDITGITLTTTASKRDFITCIYNSTADKFYVTGFVRGF